MVRGKRDAKNQPDRLPIIRSAASFESAPRDKIYGKVPNATCSVARALEVADKRI